MNLGSLIGIYWKNYKNNILVCNSNQNLKKIYKLNYHTNTIYYINQKPYYVPIERFSALKNDDDFLFD